MGFVRFSDLTSLSLQDLMIVLRWDVTDPFNVVEYTLNINPPSIPLILCVSSAISDIVRLLHKLRW